MKAVTLSKIVFRKFREKAIRRRTPGRLLHWSCLSLTGPKLKDTMATPVELLEILEALVDTEFKKFKWLLQQADVLEGFPAIPKSLLETADRLDTVDQLMDNYNQMVVEVTIKVLKRISKHELVQRLLTISCSSKESVSHCQRKLKLSLKKKLQSLLNSTSNCGNQMFLNGLYTELDVKDQYVDKVDMEQAVRQIGEEINNVKEFFNLQNCQKHIKRTLMTKGIAGVGKTILIQKVVLDWTEDKVNNSIQFVFPISFKELNLLKNKNYDIVELLHYFFPNTKEAGIHSFDGLQILFIFDGLSDCQLPLDFHNNELLNDITESATVDVLLTNLIMGRLLPSARLWITTTPEVERKIPSQYIHTVTEVEGFTDLKKDEYLRRRFRNKELACKIISHIETSERLRAWCRRPLYCHICAVVLEDELKSSNQLNTPKSLTEMYIRFFVIQSKLATAECSSDSSSVILSLAKLAFEQLLKNNQLFSEEDLREYGTNAQAISSYSEVFTQVSVECGLNQNKLYSFVHSTFHLFLAAVHVAVSFINSGINLLSQEPLTSQTSVQNLHQRAVHLVSQDAGGDVQVCLRFLLGLSLPTNENLLKDWLKLSGSSLENRDATVQFIQMQLIKNPPPDKCLNLLHCLNELCVSVEDKIQHFLSSSTYEVSPAQLSALVFILLTSESSLEEIDLRKYCRRTSDLPCLVPLIQASKRCVLSVYDLSDCQTLVSAFSSRKLKELVLSHNCGFSSIAESINDQLCQLEILRLFEYDASFHRLSQLLSVFSHEWNCLKELDFYTIITDPEGMLLKRLLECPHCKLEKLRWVACLLTWVNCDPLACYLSSPYSTLTELDLSLNMIQDAGVMVLSTALKSPHCKLEILRLKVCGLTDRSCDILASVLSESCSLSRLDLSRNSVCDSGVRLLSGGMKHPRCRLTSLSLRECQLSEESCAELGSALSSHLCDLKELDLSSNDLKDSGVQLLCVGLQSTQCGLETLRLSGCMVTEKGCASLASALSSNPSHLTELDLSYNHPGDTGPGLLSPRPEDPLWTLRTLCVDHGGAHRIRSGLWKYACELTLDPNTAHRNLILSENNTQLKFVRTPEPYPYHPDRFDLHLQVMCSNGLTGRSYWEVECKGSIDIAVSYRSISRRGDDNKGDFGKNDKSWCFSWDWNHLYAWHNNQKLNTKQNPPQKNRLAVFLDWDEGTLSLYTVCSGTLTHLHTLYSPFTEPLFPGFRVTEEGIHGGQLSFCQLAERVNE